MKSKVRISEISYLNTLPFNFGLKHSEYIQQNSQITKDYPSACAQKLIQGEADLGLIPVAVLPQLPNYQIVSDYCISAEGEVATVLLLSDVPLEEIESIFLDYQSKTSVKLIQILAKKFWKINPEWIPAEAGYEQNICGKRAGLVIGDRCFQLKEKHIYTYDLGLEWKKFTNLPFVFAVWTSISDLSEQYILELNNALKSGLDSISALCESYSNPLNNISNKALQNYLTQNIHYKLNDEKLESISYFLQLTGHSGELRI